MPHLFFVAFLLVAFLPRPAVAQGVEQVKAQYTKYEYRIPMRDGKKLFTAVYVPKDAGQRYPILMTRTPYSVGPYGADQYPNDPRFPMRLSIIDVIPLQRVLRAVRISLEQALTAVHHDLPIPRRPGV